MPNTILACTDGSTEAEPAIAFAVMLAELFDDQVDLLWAWEGLPDIERVLGQGLAERVTHREVQDRTERLQDLARKYCEPAGRRCSVRVPVGDPAQAIRDAGAEPSVRYAVMATHGHSGLKRWRLGSVTDKVVRACSTPVVVVRTNETLPSAISRLLLPLDGSEASELAIPHAAEIARRAGASVCVLRTVTFVVPSYPFGMEASFEKANLAAEETAREYVVAAAAQMEGVDATPRVEAGSASGIILDLAEQSDLTVMGTHGRGGWTRFALGSVTDAVIRGGKSPVLVVPPDHRDD